MATHHLNFGENPIKNGKIKSYYYYPQQTNGISFWAFLLSILIYVSIIYTFNLSPSTLFNTTKFWFFISNTLILIIAADFGAFSLSHKKDFYEEYAKNSRVRTISSFEMQYPKIVERNIPHEDIKEVDVVQKNVEKEIPESEFKENKLEIVVKDEQEKGSDNLEEKSIIEIEVDSKDDNGKKDDERNIVNLQRQQREKREANLEEKDEQFSAMSSEELNKRVEEFIQRFKRQSRLQAAAIKYQPL